jgi:hypothetical protein
VDTGFPKRTYANQRIWRLEPDLPILAMSLRGAEQLAAQW